jgi:ABC-type antimicrobial peptide transport system permease subunit
LYYRKPWLAVLAGVVISTAVLTGALIVGDSVRFSLHRMTELRLGKTRYLLRANDRFFRQELTGAISNQSKTTVIPAIQSAGIAINSNKDLRINRVQITGVDNRFLTLWDQPFRMPGTDEAVISRNVAEKLMLKVGDDLLLRIQKQGKGLSNAPFASEKEPSASIRLTVSAIAEDENGGLFSMKNNQTASYNVFLPLNQMAALLELPGFANMLLVADNENHRLQATFLDSTLMICWQPEDIGVRFGEPDPVRVMDPVRVVDPVRVMDPVRVVDPVRVHEDAFEISTSRIFFDKSTSDAILATIPGCESILTYLVNSISFGTKSTPYSFVTAANESFLTQKLADNQIIINDWLARDLGAGPGDSVTLSYFLMGPQRSLRKDSSRFLITSVIPMTSNISDRSLMPDFPGMSDAGNCRDWETGSPIDLKKIRGKDEEYWKKFRGTPKAFIPISTGQKLWSNRFGNHTAFRFSASNAELAGIKDVLMHKLKPVQYGLSFMPVFDEGQRAANNSTDFGELFLSLGFFILLSALLLTAMLFSSLARLRLAETGILSALGFRKRRILGILSCEATIVIVIGTVAGVFLGILYNHLLIRGLNTIWLDAVNTSGLVTEIRISTLFTGASLGTLTSMTVLLLILWKSLRTPLSLLVKGAAGPQKIIRRLSNKTRSIPRFSNLVIKNLALYRSRTISAVVLLAIGTFTIIITGANRKILYGSELTRGSGTGGFLLWAETSIPVMHDLNSAFGAKTTGISDEKQLNRVHFVQLPLLEGDDASCLNLNQVSNPGILGVPAGLFNRLRAFSFTNTGFAADPLNPWKTLAAGLAPDVIPAFADQSVITWGLGKSVGDTLYYRDEAGKILKLKLMGGLDNSIFQGYILISDSLFHCYYPSTAGSRITLIDGPAGRLDTIRQSMESLFRDYGMMATPAAERLASFNAVENTYLTVFIMLGGLGIIIGTIGLGIVLQRNISQRRQELALYIALGFSKQCVFKLILSEHLLILFSGLFLGIIAAVPVLFNQLISPGNIVPMALISVILMMILLNGFLWIWFTTASMLRKDLLPALRQE